MQFKTLADIIDFAISREREAADFYKEVSKQEALANMRELFLQFAAEEEKHATLLQNLKTGNIGQSLDEYDWKWIIDIKRSNYIVEIAYRPDMPYNEILMLAAKREEKALALYNECLAKAEEKEAKKVFKMLCQEEARHKLALEDKLDDLMAEMGD